MFGTHCIYIGLHSTDQWFVRYSIQHTFQWGKLPILLLISSGSCGMIRNVWKKHELGCKSAIYKENTKTRFLASKKPVFGGLKFGGFPGFSGRRKTGDIHYRLRHIACGWARDHTISNSSCARPSSRSMLVIILKEPVYTRDKRNLQTYIFLG